MGEPLYNYEEVSKALKIAMNQKGISLPIDVIKGIIRGMDKLKIKCYFTLDKLLTKKVHQGS